MYTIQIAKEYLKFSSAHFTIFNENQVERLHGHNYYVSTDIECRDSFNGIALEFGFLKRILRSLCDELDERILLPSESPYLRIVKHGDQFEVTFHGNSFSKFYSFPCEDVVILELTNVSSELLARYLCEQFIHKLKMHLSEAKKELASVVTAIVMRVEETRGQSVSFRAEV